MLGPPLSDHPDYPARMRFNRYPLFRALKSIVGWAKPAKPKSKPAAPAILKIAPCRPVIILPKPDLSLHRWQAGFRLPLTHARDRKEQSVLEAVRDNRPLTFVYLGEEESTTSRHVHPLFLFYVEGFAGSYLTAFCQLRQEVRTFRLDRMLFSTS